MNKLINSYLKNFLSHWIETLTSMVFIVLVVLSMAGIMSGPIQFKINYNQLTSVSHLWTYQDTIGNANNQKSTTYAENFEKFFFNNLCSSHKPFLDVNSGWWTNVVKKAEKLEHEQRQAFKNNAILEKLNQLYNTQNLTKIEGLGEGINALGKYNYSGIWAYYEYCTSKYAPNDKNISYNNNIIITSEKNNDKYLLSEEKTVSNLSNIPNPTFSDLNQVKIYDGRLAIAENEIVVDPVLANAKKLHVGDDYVFSDSNLPPLKIVGIGLATANVTNQANSITGYFYGTHDFLNKLARSLVGSNNYKLQENLVMLININENKLTNFIQKMEHEIENFSNKVKTLNNFNVNIINSQLLLYYVLIVVLMALSFVIIIFNMKREINRTYYQIALLKAFGFNNSKLAVIFAIKCFIIVFIAIIFGYFLSFPLQAFINKMYLVDVLLPLKLIFFPWHIILLLFLLVPMLFALVAFIWIRFYIKKDLLTLLNSGSHHYFEFLVRFGKRCVIKLPFIVKLQVAFMLKNFWRFMIIIGIFGLTSLLFIFQFNVKDIFANITNSLNYAYKNDDHINNLINNDQPMKLFHNNTYQLTNNPNMNYVSVTAAKNQFINAEKLHYKIKNYNDTKLLSYLINNIDTNLNNQFIYLDDLIRITNLVLKYQNIIKIPPQLISKMNNILKLSGELNQSKLKTIVSLNEIIYDEKQETPILSIPSIVIDPNSTTFSLTGVRQENWQKFYSFNNLTCNNVSRLFDKSEDFPIIISKKLQKIYNYHLGQQISTLFTLKQGLPIVKKLRIIGVASNDTIAREAFIDEKKIDSLFVDQNKNPINVDNGNKQSVYFYNKLISQKKLFLNDFNVKNFYYNQGNINYEMQFLNIAFHDNKQSMLNNDMPITLYTLLQSLIYPNENNKVTLYSSFNDIKSLKLPRMWLQSQGYIINCGLLILELFVGALIFLTFLTVCSALLEENRHIIFVLHCYGYQKVKILFGVLGSYFIGIILIFILAYGISLGILSALIPYIWSNFTLIINMPWSLTIPLESLGILTIILLVTWIILNYVIKSQGKTFGQN